VSAPATDARTAHDAGQDLATLDLAADICDQATGKQDCIEDRFGRQAATEFGHDDPHLHGPGTRSTVCLVEPQTEEPGLGEHAPHIDSPAARGVLRRRQLFEVVAALQ
jgi:hypothetical protein